MATFFSVHVVVSVVKYYLIIHPYVNLQNHCNDAHRAPYLKRLLLLLYLTYSSTVYSNAFWFCLEGCGQNLILPAKSTVSIFQENFRNSTCTRSAFVERKNWPLTQLSFFWTSLSCSGHDIILSRTWRTSLVASKYEKEKKKNYKLLQLIFLDWNQFLLLIRTCVSFFSIFEWSLSILI